MGPALGGRGFVLTKNEALALGATDSTWWLRRLTTGKDIMGRHHNRFVIDIRSIETEGELCQRLPKVYQHLRLMVYPTGAQNNDAGLRTFWWKFRRTNEIYFSAVQGFSRYIATVETTKPCLSG